MAAGIVSETFVKDDARDCSPTSQNDGETEGMGKMRPKNRAGLGNA